MKKTKTVTNNVVTMKKSRAKRKSVGPNVPKAKKPKRIQARQFGVTDCLHRLMDIAGVKARTSTRRAVCKVLLQLGLVAKQAMIMPNTGMRAYIYTETQQLERMLSDIDERGYYEIDHEQVNQTQAAAARR